MTERSGDLVRLGLAAVLLGLTVLAIQRDRLSLLERDVFRLVNDLPPWLLTPVHLVEQLGGRWSPVVVGLVVLVALRLPRLALGVTAAGMGAWFVAQGLKYLIERPRPADFLGDLPRDWSGGGPGFISGHTAVATAMAAALAPSLSRRGRRVVWTLAAVVGFARIYSGAHLPLDVVGGAAVGWFVGTLVHLLLGTPRPHRTPETVGAMLGRLGLPLTDVEPLDVHAEVSHPFRVRTAEGRRLLVKVLDPDPRRTDLLLRAARVFASRERRHLSAMHGLPEAADHEAAVAMAARSAGVRVPEVVLARGDGAAAVVVLTEVQGSDLAALAPGAVSEEMLEDLWGQVGALHRARIAHRDLVRANVMVDVSGRVWVLDFGDAAVGAGDDDMDGDVAELLASLAVRVGPERSVGAATRVLGAHVVDRAVPLLEPFALTARTRRELRDRPGLLGAIRSAAGAGPHDLTGLLDVRRTWLPAVVSVAGYAGLLAVAGWGESMDAVVGTRLRWVGLAAATYVVSPVLLGYAIRLAVRRRLAAGRSAVAASVAGSLQLIGGPRLRRGHLDRYLRSCGVRGREPTRAVDLVMTAELVAAVLLTTVALGYQWWRGWAGASADMTSAALLGVTFAAAGVGLLTTRLTVRGVPRAPRREALLHAARTARLSAGRAGTVLAATVGAQMAAVATLASALRAFGAAESLAVTAIALCGAMALMSLAGVSGMPVVGEALSAAVLTALGVAAVPAVLAVLLYAAYHYWLTAAVGVVAARPFTG